MSRRMKLATREKGLLDVFTIHETEGVWEGDWESLRGTSIGRSFSRVGQRAIDHVLNGWSNPLVEALGPPPGLILAALPSQHCAKQAGCHLHDPRKCLVASKKLPWCYEPPGIELSSALARTKAAEAVFLWKEEVYVIIVVQGA